MKKIRLGVNIDHAATLRQVRGATTIYPDLLQISKLAIKGGADQITVHLREDRRHIQDADVILLSQNKKIKLNLEMAISNEMVKIACQLKPAWVCLVPEKREELTTEGGLDILNYTEKIEKVIQKLHQNKIKVSLFIEPSIEQVIASKDVLADAVEFHTGSWVMKLNSKKKNEWIKLDKSARLAHELGLIVNAGHGLDYDHLKGIKKLPFLNEVNIGHSLICYSLVDGVESVTRKMYKILNG
jgi:pyridoxine 5-phosphate synthase